MPLLGALLRRELRMEQSHLRAEGRVHLPGHRRGQADFGHQQQRAPARGQGVLHGGQINRCFAGASDAVEQKRFEILTGHGGDNGGERAGLRFVQPVLVGCRLHPGEVEVQGAVLEANEVSADQGAQGGARHGHPGVVLAQQRPQLGHGQRAAGAGQGG